MLNDYVITRKGIDYALYEGLLAEAHGRGLQSIRTRLLQAPTAANGSVAICDAVVTTPRGEFTAVGEAAPGHAGLVPGRSLIQVAETRAKARALRDALNADVVPFEELDQGVTRD
jgi:hypothetical protein